ncbi:MAG: hypothetical protein RQ743_01545 [Bacteroidales bacterium]|nr:hypothetical protein [Bacteroidales bacterium]
MAKIVAIRVIDRIKEAGHTQDVLSKHSSIIKTRLGFHELNEDRCSREGYILLYLRDNAKGRSDFLKDLDKIYGIEIKEMNLLAGPVKPASIPDGSAVTVVGLVVNNRSDIASEVQRALTLYGCTIRTRMGINEEDHGHDTGLILLELKGDNSEMNSLLKRLEQIENVIVGVISFS